MKDKTKQILGIGLIAALVLAVVLGVAFINKANQEKALKVQVAAAEEQAKIQKAEALKAQEQAELAKQAAEQARLEAEKAQSEAQLRANELKELQIRTDELAKQVLELQAGPEEPIDGVDASDVYEEDDLQLSSVVPSLTLSDRKLDKLFDGEVELDGELYDAEELVYVSGLLLANDDEDYNGEVFLEVPSTGIVYLVSFNDPEFDPALIGVDEEYLAFDFLGSNIELKEWDGDEITVRRGNELFLNEGETADVEGKELSVDFVGEDSKAVISFNGISKTMSEGQTKDFGGVDVYLDTVLYNSRKGAVLVRVGEDVVETYQDGDEFVKDSEWRWLISGASKTIGVYFDEDLKGNDAEEEFNALAYGQSFGLPNNYVSLTFVGLDEVDMTDIKVEESGSLVRLTGKFEVGIESYTKLYFDPGTNQFLDDDKDPLGVTIVDVEDSDYELQFFGSWLKVDTKGTDDHLLKFNTADYSQAFFDGNNVPEDEPVINSVGMRVKAVNDFDDNDEFEFSVPEEQVFATISFS